MIVKELIEYLKKLPKDAQIGVIYQACSDYVILEEEDMAFVPAPTKEELDTPSSNPWKPIRRYVIRHGKLIEYDAKTWDKSEIPKFVPLLILPGN